MKTNIIFSFLLAGILFTFLIALFSNTICAQSAINSKSLAYDPYTNYPYYTGKDLGVTYSGAATILKIWSPPA
jgi:lipopolysaccharide export LptBFGC system permease protein LptF